MAASMACVSYGLRFFSPLRSIRPVCGLIRFSTAASGTSFTRTQIFTWNGLLWANERSRWYPIDSSVNRVVRRGRLLRYGAADEVDDVLRGRPGREHLGDAELLELRDVVG